ncbi:MAG: CHAP domain-containing protein [Candidatus Nanopelagicales bacterium]
MHTTIERRTGRATATALALLGLLLGIVGVGSAAPAQAAMSTICTGFAGCNNAGRSNFGYQNVYTQSFWGMVGGHNCTNYVAYRFGGSRPSWLPGGMGDAWRWGGQAAAAGITVNNTPAVGSIAWWNSSAGKGSYGHVAYVQEVHADGVVVSEDNYGGDFHWRKYTPGTQYPTGFIHLRDESGGNPFGYLDVATSPGPGYLRVGGWAADPDAKTSPIDVHVYANSTGFNIGRADKLREDVGRAYPGYGNYHGFDAQVTLGTGGTYTVCAYGINVGAGNNERLKDCKPVTIADPQPFGYLDTVTSPQPGTIRVRGWAVDPNSKTSPVIVHVYVGDKGVNIGKADKLREDVGKALPGYGNYHGYDTTIEASAGKHTVCAYAINVGPGSNQQLKVCKTVTVTPRPAPAQSSPSSAVAPNPAASPTPQTKAQRKRLKVKSVRVKRLSKRNAVVHWKATGAVKRFVVRSFERPDGIRQIIRTKNARAVIMVSPRERYWIRVTAIGPNGTRATAKRKYRAL